MSTENKILTNRIGLFNDSFPPIMDGVALTVYNYAYWLNKKTDRVMVVTPNTYQSNEKTEDFDISYYPSVPIPIRKPYRLGMPHLDVMQMYNLIYKTPFDIIHAHSPFSSGKLAKKVSKHQNIPLIATFHSKFRDDFVQSVKSEKIADLMIKNVMNFFNYADEVWIPQAYVEDTIREYGFKGNVEVVDNGTDFFVEKNELEILKEKTKKKLNIGKNELTLLFVGQHIWEKNTAMIIEALEIIRNIPYRMFFVGMGYAEQQMKKMVFERKLDDKVCFVGSIFDRNIIKEYYAASDLFIFPSLYDNAPLVVREAAALHTPSILVRGSTASEIIQDNVNGFLIENSAEDLAKKIKYAYMNPQILKLNGTNASITISRSWENITNEVLDRYEHLIMRKISKNNEAKTNYKLSPL